MDLSGKKLAILGGTRINIQFVQAARELGGHTCVIDYYEPESGKSPAKLCADESALISVADVKEVASFLRQNGFDGVTTGYTDSILGWYADICEEAGLPCYGNRKQFEVFTDKHLWKDLCREFKIPTAFEYGQELLDLPEEEIDFPIFVKPSDASGARGATVAHNKSELIASFKLAQSFQRNGEVLFEKYLDGPEVTVFWLFIDGKYYVNMLGNRHVKHNQKGVIPLPAGYTFPASVIPRYLDEVKPRWDEAFASLGVRNGMMFMQCIVQDGLPYVYDIGFRTTGSLEHHIQKAAFGYSTTDMLISHALTGHMTDDPAISEKVDLGLYHPCYNISWLIRPGTVDHFVGLENLSEDPSFISCHKAYVEGETLPVEALGQLRQICLRGLGATDTVDGMGETILKLQAAVDIIDPDGESLKLSGMEPSDFAGTILE